MIDLHTHILPGLDDGAQTLEDSLSMARIAVRDGILRLVATPHGHEWGTAAGRDELETRVKELQLALTQNDIALTVYPGLEVYMAPDLGKQLENGSAFPLNGTRYVLIELPLQSYPPYTEQVFFDVQVRGFRPILAHPERNEDIQRNHRLLENLVERGILAQVTASSLLGAWGTGAKKAAETFLERRLVHVMASDAHQDAGLRAPILSRGVQAAAKIIGPESAAALVETTPDKILADQDIEPELPLAARARRSWLFWR